MHRPARTDRIVVLRTVLERMCLRTGVITTFVLDKDAPEPLTNDTNNEGGTHYTSAEYLFTERMVDAYNHNNPHHLFTLTEQEYEQ